MNILLKYKKIFSISFVAILLLISLIIYINNNKEIIVESKEIVKVIENKEEIPEPIYVDIKGEVIKPGIYMLEGKQRINDVIALAGGLTKNASTRSINLSKIVFDEMVIIIHSKKEIEDFIKVEKEESQLVTNCQSLDYNITNDACLELPTKSEVKVSLNKANLDDLLTLTGIGEAKAQSIIDYRKKIGEFKQLEEILEVSGIGEALFAQIKDYITL